MDVAITPDLVSNGILSFVAINFFLLLSLWTKLAGLLATAFVVVLCQGWNGIEAHARGHCNSKIEPGTQDSALISQICPLNVISGTVVARTFGTLRHVAVHIGNIRVLVVIFDSLAASEN
eukprot:TCALIF_13672-PA protein Name:"Protein of unknown function" AED:0.12 eAED:0.12 QI:8/1/0.5/1/1/1/2/95/119